MAVRPAGQVVVLLWPRNCHSRNHVYPRRWIARYRHRPRDNRHPGNDRRAVEKLLSVVPSSSTSVEGRGHRTRFLFPCARNYGSQQVTLMKGNRKIIFLTSLIFAIPYMWSSCLFSNREITTIQVFAYLSQFNFVEFRF